MGRHKVGRSPDVNTSSDPSLPRVFQCGTAPQTWAAPVELCFAPARRFPNQLGSLAASPDADTSRLSEQGWKHRSKIRALWPAVAELNAQRHGARPGLFQDNLLRYLVQSQNAANHPGLAPYARALRPPAKLSTTASTMASQLLHLHPQTLANRNWTRWCALAVATEVLESRSAAGAWQLTLRPATPGRPLQPQGAGLAALLAALSRQLRQRRTEFAACGALGPPQREGSCDRRSQIRAAGKRLTVTQERRLPSDHKTKMLHVR